MGIQIPDGNGAVPVPTSGSVDFLKLYHWIQRHEKREKAFPTFSDFQLFELLAKHAREETLHVIFDQGSPVGVVVYKVDSDYLELFVYSLLCDYSLAFKTLIARWKERFPGWNARSNRRGHEVVLFQQSSF
jgi:hypothetical protein